MGGPGSADRVQGVGLALPAAVLAVGAVDLDDPDAGRGDVPGQSGAVAAGPFDPDQADRPEPAQPAEQAGVAGRGGREFPGAEQAPDGIQRGGNVHVGVSARAAGNGANFSACLYDGHSHPFLRLRDGTHPLAVGPVKPWPLIQARQIRPAAPAGARKNWDPAGRSFRKTTRRGVSRIEGQAGTQAPDPTHPSPQDQGSRAGSTIHTLPAESGVGRGPDRGVGVEARIGRYGAAISERLSPARISARYAPGSASTIDSTASKGARKAPSRWCRPARNPGEL